MDLNIKAALGLLRVKDPELAAVIEHELGLSLMRESSLRVHVEDTEQRLKAESRAALGAIQLLTELGKMPTAEQIADAADRFDATHRQL
jgi:hypothetical protein